MKYIHALASALAISVYFGGLVFFANGEMYLLCPAVVKIEGVETFFGELFWL